MKTILLSAFLILTTRAFAATFPVNVTENGFEPSILKVKEGQDTTLAVTRKTDETCAKEIVITSKKIRKELPLNKTVSVNLGKLKKGEVKFSCGMDMISGVVNIQ